MPEEYHDGEARPVVTPPVLASSGVQLTAAPTTDYPSADALSAAGGFPVYEPTRWPGGTGPRSYHLTRSSGATAYHIAASCGGRELLVIGFLGEFDSLAPLRGWADVPRVGRVRVGVAGAAAVISRPGQSIHLQGFPSGDDVIAAARSVPPAL